MKRTMQVFVFVSITSIAIILFQGSTAQKYQNQSIDELVGELPKQSQDLVYKFLRNDRNLNLKLSVEAATMGK